MLVVFFLAGLIVAYVVCRLFPGVELDHLSGRIRTCREEGCRGKEQTKGSAGAIGSACPNGAASPVNVTVS
jgi:hypothetical protein